MPSLSPIAFPRSHAAALRQAVVAAASRCQIFQCQRHRRFRRVFLFFYFFFSWGWLDQLIWRGLPSGGLWWPTNFLDVDGPCDICCRRLLLLPLVASLHHVAPCCTMLHHVASKSWYAPVQHPLRSFGVDMEASVWRIRYMILGRRAFCTQRVWIPQWSLPWITCDRRPSHIAPIASIALTKLTHDS